MATRLEPARRRARLAQLTIAGGAAALFATSMALARVHFAGHHQQGATPLAPPGPLLEVVRHDQLQAGLLAPAEAAPGIVSAPS